jgi:hypothetical protein
LHKTTTTKSVVSLAKVLDLFLWHPILVLVLMTGGYSVSLCLLTVGILGYVGKSAAPLVGQLAGELAGTVFFPPTFLGLMGFLLKVEALM